MEEYKTCNRCKRKLPKTKKYFYGGNNSGPGLTYVCKDCWGNNTKYYPEYKVCIRCKTRLPKDKKFFYININGLSDICKECRWKRKYTPTKYKICSRCKRELPRTNEYFSIAKTNRDGLKYTCKECVNKQRREYYSSEKYKRNYSPEKTRDSHLKKEFGISLDDYNDMLKAQDNKCAICGVDNSKTDTTLAVDHNHKTGAVRALLCNNCNWLIGQCNENVMVLDNAIAYIYYFNYVIKDKCNDIIPKQKEVIPKQKEVIPKEYLMKSEDTIENLERIISMETIIYEKPSKVIITNDYKGDVTDTSKLKSILKRIQKFLSK